MSEVAQLSFQSSILLEHSELQPCDENPTFQLKSHLFSVRPISYHLGSEESVSKSCIIDRIVEEILRNSLSLT